MYLVKENTDGTVTIKREIYNELHRKAEAYERIMETVVNCMKRYWATCRKDE